MTATMSEILTSLPIILSLIVMEGLLSVDNALGIAAMARHLPPRQRALAMRWGIFGAYAFRGLALVFANSFAHVDWVRWLGAAYLLYLMVAHFGSWQSQQDNHPPVQERSLFATIMAINLLDLSLSVDNVLAAVALDNRLWVICTGVFIGILVLRFAAGYCIQMIEKYPILEHTAFLLIGYVGVLLVIELLEHFEVAAWEKFLGVVVILWVSLTYARQPAWQRVLGPVLRVLRQPCWWVQTGLDKIQFWKKPAA